MVSESGQVVNVAVPDRILGSMWGWPADSACETRKGVKRSRASNGTVT